MANGPFLDPKLNAFLATLAQNSAQGQKSLTSPVGTTGGGYAAGSLQPHFNLTPAQEAAITGTGMSLSDAANNPAILKILNNVEKDNASIGIKGGVQENNQKRQGLVTRVFDILQRPMYAMAEGSKRAGEDIATGQGIGSTAADFGRGALSGIEGKSKTDFTQVLQEIQDLHKAEAERGMAHGWLNHASGPQVKAALAEAKSNPGMGGRLGIAGTAAGFGLDIVGDPLTYTGLGTVAKAKGAIELTDAAKSALAAMKSSEHLAPESRDIISGALYSAGKQSQKAALGAVPNKVHEIAQQVAKSEGAHTFDKTVGQLMGSEISHADLLKAAKEAGSKREATVLQQVMDNYNKVADTKIPNQLAVRLGKTKIGIPGTDLIAATAKGAASRVNVVNKSMALFNKKFVTKSTAFPELHSQQLSQFGEALTKARLFGRALRHDLNPLGKDGRAEALSAFLNNHASKNTVTMADGKTVDAAHYYGLHVRDFQHAVDELGMTPKDLNVWAAHHTQFNQGKITRIVNGKKKSIPDPEWVKNSMPGWKTGDGADPLWFAHNALQKAKAWRGMMDSIGGTFGAHLPEDATYVHKALYKSLQDKGWVEAKNVPELKGHIFDPETAGYVTHIANTLKGDQNFNKFWSGIARINRPIKFALTLPNPAFHWHNAVGDAFVNHLDGISPWTHYYEKSASVLKHRNKFFETYDPEASRFPLLSLEGDPLQNARRQNPNFDAALMKNRNKLRSADGKIHDQLTQAELYAGYNHFGLRQNYASELGLTDNSPVGKLKTAVDKVQAASEAREDYMRLAHFIGLVDKNPSGAKTLQDAMEHAARRVRETHFDYTDFTKFEKEVMSQIIPFYKWSRKAMPLMTQVMLTQPGKAVQVSKSLRALANLTGNSDIGGNDTLPNLEGAVVPKWMRDSGYVPISSNFMLSKGNPAFGYVSNPFSDMFTQQLNGVNDGTPNLTQMLLGQTTPIIKDPVELAQNQNSFTGGKIINTDPGKPSVPAQLLQYMASQTPITNVANQAQKGNLGTLLSWLSPMSVQVDTPTRQKSELVRERQVAQAILREVKYKHRNDLKFGKLNTLK